MKSKKFRANLITYAIVIAAFIACQVLISTGVMTRSLKGQLVPICAYIVMAISLNLTVGISGELSLGHAGFMSVGAFSGIVMSMWLSKGMGLDNKTVVLLMAIITGGVAAGIAGVLIGIPVLRLRGDYLAIVTLAFGEIIRNVINCLYISLDGSKLHVAFNNPNVAGKLLINGPAGATGVSQIATFGMGFALVLFTLFVVLNLIDSRSGRAIMAIRDNRIAAEAMGLNVTKYKMMAFVTSAVLAGMAGALYGVLGGIGNIRGSIISATLLTILPELLRAFANYRMLIYAIVLILVMLATNNPTLRSMMERIIPQKRGNKKEADEA